MVVALPVVAHGCAAGDLTDHLQRDVLFSVLDGRRRYRKIQTAQCFAQIAACALCKVGTGILVHIELRFPVSRELLHRIVQTALHIRCRQSLELEHRAPGQQRIINVEVRIFGGGCNQRHRAVLNAFQQALLLLFVQILDLVQIQQDAARSRQRTDVLEHRLDVPCAAGCAVQLVQCHTAVFCNDAGHGGLARAGWAIEDHIGDTPALDGTAEHPVRRQQMLLATDVCQSFGPQALRQWFVHRVPSSHTGQRTRYFSIVYRIYAARAILYLKIILR